jgi:glucokinase
MKPTRQAMEDNLLQVFKNQVKIIFSDLKEADAAFLVQVLWYGKF